MPPSIKGLTIEEAAVIRGLLEREKKEGIKKQSQSKGRHVLCEGCEEGTCDFPEKCCGVLQYNHYAKGYTHIALENCPRWQAHLVKLGAEFGLEHCDCGTKRQVQREGTTAFVRALKSRLIKGFVFSSSRISLEFVAEVKSVALKELKGGSNTGPSSATPGTRPPAAAAPDLGLAAVSAPPPAAQKQLTGGISCSETPTVAAGVRFPLVSVQASAVQQQRMGGSGNTGPSTAAPGVSPSAAAPTVGLATAELINQPLAATITDTAAGNQASATDEQINKIAVGVVGNQQAIQSLTTATTAGFVRNQQAIQSLTSNLNDLESSLNDLAGHVKTGFTQVGQRLDEQGRRLEDQEQRLDEQGLRVEDQGRRLDEQGRRVDDQEQRLDEQGLRVDDQGRRLDEQGRRVDDQEQRLDKHGQCISQVEKTALANLRSLAGEIESDIHALDNYNGTQDMRQQDLKRRFEEMDQSTIKGFASFERSRDEQRSHMAAVDKQLADQKAKNEMVEQRLGFTIDVVDEQFAKVGPGLEELQRSLRKTNRKVRRQERKLATVCDRLGITDDDGESDSGSEEEEECKPRAISVKQGTGGSDEE